MTGTPKGSSLERRSAVVIAATGYWIDHPFFDRSVIDFSEGAVPLYLRFLPEKPSRLFGETLGNSRAELKGKENELHFVMPRASLSVQKSARNSPGLSRNRIRTGPD